MKRRADRADSKTIPIFSNRLKLKDVLVSIGGIVIIPKAVENGIIPKRAKAGDPVWNPGFAECLSDNICLPLL